MVERQACELAPVDELHLVELVTPTPAAIAAHKRCQGASGGRVDIGQVQALNVLHGAQVGSDPQRDRREAICPA